jgi:hypothetical protein
MVIHGCESHDAVTMWTVEWTTRATLLTSGRVHKEVWRTRRGWGDWRHSAPALVVAAGVIGASALQGELGTGRLAFLLHGAWLLSFLASMQVRSESSRCLRGARHQALAAWRRLGRLPTLAEMAAEAPLAEDRGLRRQIWYFVWGAVAISVTWLSSWPLAVVSGATLLFSETLRRRWHADESRPFTLLGYAAQINFTVLPPGETEQELTLLALTELLLKTGWSATKPLGETRG